MNRGIIKNFESIAQTENRRIALELAEAGIGAISTRNAVRAFVSLDRDILRVQGAEFDLSKFKKIKIVGFGKSSFEAALALEEILGDRIEKGAVIDVNGGNFGRVEIFTGSHPKPTRDNLEAGRKIYQIAEEAGEDDLVLVIVSGGGSALLCYSEEECEQGAKLYDAFLHSGKTIGEINTVRKHLSLLKGGGLAKLCYPATIIGLVFSDIPGNHFENVASGPTYKDSTTVADAEKIIEENKLGKFELIETPKEDKYFEKVRNFVLVSNELALLAMKKEAEGLGFDAKIISAELYKETGKVLERIFSAGKENSVVLAAGEPSVAVPKSHGKGGRNLYMGLLALEKMKSDKDSVFISFASDGIDNTDAAGAVVDFLTAEKIKELDINTKEALKNFDSYGVFKKSGDLIITGSTGANVSDLMIFLNKK